MRVPTLGPPKRKKPCALREHVILCHCETLQRMRRRSTATAPSVLRLICGSGGKPTHPLTAAQRIKDNCRSYAGTYLRRGKLTREPCEACGETAEMHHEDYAQPLLVRWLCRVHHLAEHRA